MTPPTLCYDIYIQTLTKFKSLSKNVVLKSSLYQDQARGQIFTSDLNVIKIAHLTLQGGQWFIFQIPVHKDTKSQYIHVHKNRIFNHLSRCLHIPDLYRIGKFIFHTTFLLHIQIPVLKSAFYQWILQCISPSTISIPKYYSWPSCMKVYTLNFFVKNQC